MLCLWGGWAAARAGAALLLARYATLSGARVAADEAARLDPAEPEAVYARGLLLSREGDHAAAAREFERAIRLRPRDLVLWQELAGARERAGDSEGAAAAARQAVELAPSYAQTRWQLGNILLRAGRREEAAIELRRAAAREPSRFPALADLAWGATRGDADAVVRIVAPPDARTRLALARFFAKRGAAESSVRLFHEAGAGVGEDDRRALAAELIGAGRYAAAHEVWAGAAASPPQVADGGFESQTGFGGTGFEWRFARGMPGVGVSLDDARPHGGARSLLVTFSGASDASAPILSQLIRTAPGARYRLEFAACSSELMGAGTPAVVVLTPKGERTLALSEPLPADSDWRVGVVEFESPGEAALIVVRREGCAEGAPCPAFGRAWFDDFSLRKL